MLMPSTRAEGPWDRLIYAANVSLDGFLEDENGEFDWSEPDEAVHAFWNEHERQIGTSLYGRRMYETMRVWEDDDWLAGRARRGPRVRRGLEGLRQGRLLLVAHRGDDRAHEARAAVRPGGGAAAQGDVRTRT